MAGGINLQMSHRLYCEECKYWKRDEKDSNLSEYKHKQYNDGFFYAKEENSRYKAKNVVGDAFMFDSSTITISTVDIIDIETDDVVKFRDEYWRVVSIQEKTVQKTVRYQRNSQNKVTYLQLKK